MHDPADADIVAALRSAATELDEHCEPIRADEIRGVHLTTARADRRTSRVRSLTIGAAASILLMGALALASITFRGDGRNSLVSTGTATTVPGTNAVVDSSRPATTAHDAAEPFPAADPAAMNILIVGVDNDSCVSPDSPFAGGLGDRSGFGRRSDTIMMWRVEPDVSRLSVLSFPRDLWVDIAGRDSRSRINAAFEPDDPQRLIDTIALNFGILTDHFIQVDFCAFTTMVDAVGGVSVPFETPVRDVNSGLNVAEAGCFEMDGDHALAYVRSRKLEVFVDGEWVRDGLGDLSRISRQQDFLVRVLAEITSNRFSPDTVRGLLETSDEMIVTDVGMTVDKVLEVAGVLDRLEPNEISTNLIDTVGVVVAGNAVLEPNLDTESMHTVLAFFRGESPSGEPGAPVNSSIPTEADGSAGPVSDADPLGSSRFGVGPDPTVSCVD